MEKDEMKRTVEEIIEGMQNEGERDGDRQKGEGGKMQVSYERGN